MLPFFRPKNDKDIGDKLVGKQKKYRLARNGSAVAVTGTLLAFYRRDVLPDAKLRPQKSAAKPPSKPSGPARPGEIV